MRGVGVVGGRREEEEEEEKSALFVHRKWLLRKVGEEGVAAKGKPLQH